MKIVNAGESKSLIVGSSDSHTMTTGDTSLIFHLLSENLYSDGVLASFREIITNAWDSHIVSGCTDIPVKITVKDNTCTIEDSGSGIPHDLFKSLYGTLGGTSKNECNNTTGGMGIGKLAPLTVCDNFIVINKHDGEAITYSINKGSVQSQGVHTIDTLAQYPTDSTGLTVIFTVNADIDVHINNIFHFLVTSDIRASFSVETPERNHTCELEPLETDSGNLVDNHTRTVPQDLHTIVSMPREGVDSNGHLGCSRGLHVASSEYVKSFSGNVLQLVLVEPENIISVPYDDRTKMRVCEYGIVYQFSPTQAQSFYTNGSAANEKIIAYFTAGNIPVFNKKVFIKEPRNLEITDISTKAVAGTSNNKKAVVQKGKKPVLDVKQVSQSVKLIPLLSLFESASTFADKKSRYQDLLAYKRKQKKSWEKLGVSPEMVKVLNDFAGKI